MLLHEAVSQGECQLNHLRLLFEDNCQIIVYFRSLNPFMKGL